MQKSPGGGEDGRVVLSGGSVGLALLKRGAEEDGAVIDENEEAKQTGMRGALVSAERDMGDDWREKRT